MKVSTILDQIDLGSFALPKFQRGYVWNRVQVRGFTYRQICMEFGLADHHIGMIVRGIMR